MNAASLLPHVMKVVAFIMKVTAMYKSPKNTIKLILKIYHIDT